jgi:hypothetical protein
VSGNPCAVTPPENGYIGNCPSSLASGSACQFACESGYVLVGSATTCTNGTLTAQSCQPQACIVNSPAFGTLGTCPSSLPSGSTCSFTCLTGYSISGPVTSCQFGQLTAQTCSPTSCSVTAPANGYLGTCSSVIASGTGCQFQCQSGYDIQGSETYCSYGQLIQQQSCTPGPCSVVAPQNGTLGNCSSTLASGGTCQLACNSGYVLTGSATSCTAGTVTEQTCTPAPPPPPQGTDAPMPLWALGAIAAFLIGIATRRLKNSA